MGLAGVAVATAALSVMLVANAGFEFGTAFAGALFSIASLASTTGLVYHGDIASHITLPAAFVFVMVGGIYGSTAGGLKIGRVLQMLRDARSELERLIHPSAVPRLAGRVGNVESGRLVWTYFVAYLIVFTVLAAITAYHGIDFEHALFWSAAMVSNSGPALGYLPMAELDPLRLIASGNGNALLLASAATMVLGRIEVLALLAILTTSFWRR